MTRPVKWLIWGFAILVVLGFLGTVAIMMVVFSIGTAMVDLDVTTTVLGRERRQPVAGCLLAFEKSHTSGYGRTTARTDARGVARHEIAFSYTGSMFMPWMRERRPALTMFVGAPPRHDTLDETESWVIQLPFEEPYFADRVSPRVSVERRIAFEDARRPDGRFQQAGSRAAAAPAADALAPVAIRLARNAEGRPVYEIPLTIHLDEAQVKACTAPDPP